MGLFDRSYFDASTYSGNPNGLYGGLLEQLGLTAPLTMPGNGFADPPTSTVAYGGQQVPVFGRPEQAAIPPQAQPVQYQQPMQQPAGNPLSAAADGFASNLHTGPLGAIIGGLGGLLTGRGPSDNMANVQQALISKGVDPAVARTIASDPDMMRAVLPQFFKSQSRALTPQEKQSLGLPPALPWFVGQDGKPYVPEGYSQGLPQEIKAPNGMPMAWNRSTNTAQPIAGTGVAGPKFDDVSSVRKEISALPETKRYGEAVPIFRSMLNSKGVNSAAADLDFVYGVAKIFDPESVVREGEMKLVGKAQSIPEEIKALMGAVVSGQARLSPEARDRILQVAQTRMTELRGAYDTRIEPYRGIAKRNQMNEADILPTLQDMPEFKSTAPPLPPAGVVPTMVYDPKTKKMVPR